MFLFVGLGNPETKYLGNRHNIGFMVIDALADQQKLNHLGSKCGGQLYKGTLAGESIIALKPETFMNRSGISVGQAMQFYKIKPENVIVFHDELDLPFGKIRVKIGGGAGGHNGLKSIDQHIGKNYWRVRIGIDHPGRAAQVSSYVLSDFSKAEQDDLATVTTTTAKASDYLITKNAAKMMNDVALTLQDVVQKHSNKNTSQ